MSGFTFDEDKAKAADGGTGISKGGHYVGVITKAKYFKRDTGSGGIEFAVKNVDGAKADYLKIYTKNKNGEPNFAVAKVHALMGLLGLKELPAVKDAQGAYEFPACLDKRIGYTLQREDYRNASGDLKYSMNILHWHSAETKQTYTEAAADDLPTAWNQPVEDIRISAGGVAPQASGVPAAGNPFPEDDLPF